MSQQESRSEIANFRERQALEEQAAHLALYGYAAVAKHERIAARMKIGGERIVQLIKEGKHEEAQALMNTENWGVEEKEVSAVHEIVPQK